MPDDIIDNTISQLWPRLQSWEGNQKSGVGTQFKI